MEKYNMVSNSTNIYILWTRRNRYKIFEDYINSIKKLLNASVIHEIDKNVDIMNKNNIVIFIQTLNIWPFTIKIDNKNKNLFVLNTEQLTVKKRLDYIKKVSKDFTIIDYSKENIDIMNKNNIKNTIYFPYIYNPDEIYNFKKTDDICGINLESSERRCEFLNNLLSKNIKIYNIEKWGETRDNILFKYKIILNISSQEDYNIFETMRCNRCLFNKMIIISEEKYRTDLIDYANHILFANITDIPELVVKVLSNYEYYYKKLDLDNIDYTLNNHLINPQKLIQNSVI